MTQEFPVRRRLRLGMVGGGAGAFIGAVHRMAARLDDRWELVAGALSSDPANARASAAEHGIEADRCYLDWREMARAEAGREDGIDAVSVVTPNHLHFEVCMAFLDAGIPVICDKPMTTTTRDARALAAKVRETGLVFVLTQNNTGYPMVRHARELARSGALGEIRIVQASYAQEFLATRIEDTGLRQAVWRTDPERSGRTATLGDIGVHAFNLAQFVTGLELEAVSADIHTFVEGRRLDDNAHVMLRWANGAKGMLWASQTAVGTNNRLRIEVYGSQGSIQWCGETPEELILGRLGEPPKQIVRGGTGAGEDAARVTRMPPGHPEGYVEAFATLYRDAAAAIEARGARQQPSQDVALLPSVADGFKGVAFIHAALDSGASGGDWTAVETL